MQFDYTDFILVWQEKTTKGGARVAKYAGTMARPALSTGLVRPKNLGALTDCS